MSDAKPRSLNHIVLVFECNRVNTAGETTISSLIGPIKIAFEKVVALMYATSITEALVAMADGFVGGVRTLFIHRRIPEHAVLQIPVA